MLPPGQVIEEFKQRRTRQWIAAIPGVVAFLLFYLALRHHESPVPGLNPQVLTGVAGVVVVAYVIFSIWNWRCPACNRYLGKGMNPAFCAKCGAKLKA